MAQPELKSRHLFDIDIVIDPPQAIGTTPFGDRRIVTLAGGTFEGERLRGQVLPGGGDWLLARNDGALQLDVRLTMRTDDSELIYMTYRGIRHGPAAVIERVNRGEPVDPSAYYFRTAPFFETGAEKYDWLNRVVAVAMGTRSASGPRYTVFEIL
ncbi:MAG: DUF3237 domain-containing protein [Alphaproteobacteria bacterium]|jgi:hypothetical protein|nr:DUF3237 domain-containing protein [Alphaproteobacteria bacterium]MDP6517200.1 DUF3237 domain-containing protein [Alphaproteobacteria bacterium]